MPCLLINTDLIKKEYGWILRQMDTRRQGLPCLYMQCPPLYVGRRHTLNAPRPLALRGSPCKSVYSVYSVCNLTANKKPALASIIGSRGGVIITSPPREGLGGIAYCATTLCVSPFTRTTYTPLDGRLITCSLVRVSRRPSTAYTSTCTASADRM